MWRSRLPVCAPVWQWAACVLCVRNSDETFMRVYEHAGKPVHMCLSVRLQMPHSHPTVQVLKQLKASEDESEAACSSRKSANPPHPNWPHLPDSNSLKILFLFLYLNGKPAATIPTVWVIPFQLLKYHVSFYAFNLEQSKVYRSPDYKQYLKVFKLVWLQASFFGLKAARNFTHTLTERRQTLRVCQEGKVILYLYIPVSYY